MTEEDAVAEERSVRARITGHVQGVWFRAWTVETATGFGLAGWVRNRSDGSVEAVFSGAADRVQAMIEACWKGPSAARVTEVAVSEEPSPPAGTGFRQVPTV